MKKFIDVQDSLFQWALHPHHLFEYGLELNIDPSKLLENTQIREHDIADIDLMISWLQYKELAVNVQKYGGEDWGFQFGKRLNVSSHGLLSLLLLNCSDWNEVIDLMEGLPNLISPIFYVTKRETSDYVTLTVHPESTRHPILVHSMETLFTSFYQMILQLGGEDLENSPEKIKILVKGLPPSYQQEMSVFFQNNIYWGNYANQIQIKKSLLQRKIPNANPITASSTKRMLNAQLSHFPGSKGGLNELRELFKQGIYKQEECAKQLFTTLPTFKRYLKNACTSFSHELSAYRIEEACWAAISSDQEAADISDRLGFQDANSFGRLFKKEIGLTFNDFRNQYHQPMTIDKP